MVIWSQGVHGNSKWHNFWFKTPNWSILFAKYSSWPILLKTSLAMHGKSVYDPHSSSDHFGGNFYNSKLAYDKNKITIPSCPLVDFEWIQAFAWETHVYYGHDNSLSIFFTLIQFSLIMISTSLILISVWLVDHINSKP